MVNNFEGQKVRYRPRIVGEYSHIFTIPAWWMRIHGFPEFLELTIALDKLELRPPQEKEAISSAKQQ